MFFKRRKLGSVIAETSQVQEADAALVRYEDDRKLLIEGLGDSQDWPFGTSYPMLNDWNDQGGTASGHYFHQDLWAAQRIHQHNPKRHIDIGSRVDGFVAHVASFRHIEVFDIRPIEARVPNMTFRAHDFMQRSLTSICDSLSCLHAIEHFGLGRYGDPVDARGYLKGFENISALLARDGTFYFSVPIGRQRIEFNAHRVFGLGTAITLYESYGFQLHEFSYVDDAGVMHPDVKLASSDVANSLGLDHGCGLFELIKTKEQRLQNKRQIVQLRPSNNTKL